MKKPVTIITGGTGLIGTALSKSLVSKGHEVIILTRDPSAEKRPFPGIVFKKWDIEKQEIDGDAIRSADYIVHLAGANVAGKRWTAKRKKEIVDSRVKSSGLLVKALNDIPNTIQAVISASAIGWYGADPQIPNPHPFRENDPAADNFLGTTCVKWEESISPVEKLGKRLVKIRTGIVLSPEGGALPEFVKSLKFGVATILGTGRQVISWIHIDDLVRIYVQAIENSTLHGVYNGVAPQPVTNQEMVLKLAHWKKGKYFIPIHVPAFMLKLVLGEMSYEVLKSATVSCDKLHIDGFTFLHPSLDSAITAFEKEK